MKRIKAITDLIAYGSIADIGTGDGVISILALEMGKAKKSIACDLNTGPLEVTKRNAAISGYGIGSNEIEFRLAFGMDAIMPGEAGTIIIAGMGGQTISDIIVHAGHVLPLIKKEEKKTSTTISQLILQPQSDHRTVRKSVHMVGFRIVDEIMIKERNKYYIIMDCRQGSDASYSESDYLLGKFLPKRDDVVFFEYIKSEIAQAESIISSIKGVERARAKLLESERDLEIMRKLFT